MKKPRSRAPKDLLNEAKRISGRGENEEAARALLKLAEDYPDDIDVQIAYAAVLFQLRRYADAAPHFERILRDAPTHEWASLGLFHSLWQIERKQDAVDEIRRFRDAGGDSMEYRRFFRDLREVR